VKNVLAQVLKELSIKFVQTRYQLVSKTSVSRKTAAEETTRVTNPDRLSGKEKVPNSPLDKEIGER
jgi:hypothetical protein